VRRFFNLLEAEGLLPQVERLLRTLIRSKQEYEEVDAELPQIKQRIAVPGQFRLAIGPCKCISASLRSRTCSGSGGLVRHVRELAEKISRSARPPRQVRATFQKIRPG
jgi:hypothetical protein